MKIWVMTWMLLPCLALAEGPSTTINVGQAVTKKELMALPPFQFQGSPALAKNSIRVGKELFDVVFNDLQSSAYFEFIAQEAFGDMSKLGLKPAPGEPAGFKYDIFQRIGADYLIRAGYRIVDDDLTFEAYLYRVKDAKPLLAKLYKGALADVRVVAHTFTNDIVKELTGNKGIFLTKVVTARTSSPQQKEIFIMDWDGANVRQITTHKTISQSPAWSPDGKTIVYTAFAMHVEQKTRNADLFSYELQTGKRWLLAYRKGINSGGAFFPDGKNIIFTSSSGGNPDMFKITVEGKNMVRLTDGPRGAMNVEPAVSPDGSKIAFSSDRSGQPMIYVMKSDGTQIKRMTFAGTYNSTPAWSPDGKKLAFAGYEKSHFDIFVMDADGTNMVRLTTANKPSGKPSDNESPSFSPDGRHVMFVSNRTGANQIFMVNLDGTNERRLTFDRHDYFKPQWSPY